jgi:WD40 repeat protein
MPNVILATGGYDHTIKLWEVYTGFCYRTMQYAESQINKIEISPNKNYIIAGGNPQLKLFEVAGNNPQAICTFQGHKGNITAVGFEHEGSWFWSASEDGSVKIWDIRTPNYQRDFQYSEPCNHCTLHPNQDEFVCAYQNGVVRVYHINRGEPLAEWRPDDDTPLRSVAVNPLGTHCVIGNNKGICFAYSFVNGDTAQQQLIEKWKAHPRYILKVLFSPNNQLLATTSADHTAKLWSTKFDNFDGVDDDQNKNIKRNKYHSYEPASTSSNTNNTTNAANQNLLRSRGYSLGFRPLVVTPPIPGEADERNHFTIYKTLSGHQRWVWDCAFSSDSEFLVTASSDHSCRLWHIESGNTVRHYTGHHKAVVCLALNDSDKTSPFTSVASFINASSTPASSTSDSSQQTSNK